MLLILLSTSKRINLHQNNPHLKTLLKIKLCRTKRKTNNLKWFTFHISFLKLRFNNPNSSPFNSLLERTLNHPSRSLVIPHLLYLNTLCLLQDHLQDLWHQLESHLHYLQLNPINNLKEVNKSPLISFSTIQLLNPQHRHLLVQMHMPTQMQMLNKDT